MQLNSLTARTFWKALPESAPFDSHFGSYISADALQVERIRALRAELEQAELALTDMRRNFPGVVLRAAKAEWPENLVQKALKAVDLQITSL